MQFYIPQDHFNNVILQSEFLLLPPDDLYKLLASDELNVQCEAVVFQVQIYSYIF